MSSLQLTTPLILPGDPTQPRHASTKQYVDTVLGYPNAAGFTSGTIPVAKLPALTGVVSSAAGNNVLTLNNSGVTPGTYTKVTVSTSGRVTAGAFITENEIQNVDWSRITSGKPTTLAGYGITDVLSSSGGTITGTLKLTQPPSNNLHPVTKAYVDNALVTTQVSLASGDIIRKPTSVTPSGFLRLNGGVLSKTTYAALYAKVGDTFGVPGWFGAGRPWEQLNYLGASVSGSISNWESDSNLYEPVEYSAALVTKNKVFLIGGYSSSSGYSALIQTASIDSDGVIGTWTQGTNLPEAVSNHGLFVTKNRVYIAGGADNSGFKNKTFFAPINPDGTLGTWSAGPVLPGTMTDPAVFVTKNRVYLVSSAYNGSYQTVSVVLTATIDSNGVVGSWSRVSDLPYSFYGAKVIVTISRVYFVYNDSLYYVPINSDGTIGSIVQEPNFPESMQGTSVVALKNRVYLLSRNGGSSTYTAAINENGIIGEWSRSAETNGFIRHRSVPVVTSSRVYLLGGRTTVMVWQTMSAPLGAGFNDYSAYYGTLTSSDYFSIPDYSSREGHRLCYYIKT